MIKNKLKEFEKSLSGIVSGLEKKEESGVQLLSERKGVRIGVTWRKGRGEEVSGEIYSRTLVLNGKILRLVICSTKSKHVNSFLWRRIGERRSAEIMVGDEKESYSRRMDVEIINILENVRIADDIWGDKRGMVIYVVDIYLEDAG